MMIVVVVVGTVAVTQEGVQFSRNTEMAARAGSGSDSCDHQWIKNRFLWSEKKKKKIRH